MSLVGFLFKMIASSGDKKRDRGLQIPENLELKPDIPYAGKNRRQEKLDVYLPKGVREKLPVIVNVHGGGWVYGSKDAYLFYCLSLAQQGFAVVNMNYYLAPGKKFPTQLCQIDQVLRWIWKNADEYRLDTENVFMVGDSAGAQMVSQYAAMLTNPGYAALFPFPVQREISLRAVGLNCGTYEIRPVAKSEKKKLYWPKNAEEGQKLLQSEEAFLGLMEGLMRDYLGKDGERFLPMLDVKGNVTSAFPPSFLMTASNDFVREQAQPMCDLLRSRGVDAVCRCYGTAADTHMTHVCHTNMHIAEAKQMNLDELAFFKEHMKKREKHHV